MKINDWFMCRARDVEGGSEAIPFNIPQYASKRSEGVNAETKCGRLENVIFKKRINKNLGPVLYFVL